VPMVHLLPHWNWVGKEGQPIEVWAYTNTDAVELLLNGKSLGRQTMMKDSHLVWSVPYAAGSLIARGYRNGKMVASDEVDTTGIAKIVQLTADRNQIAADGRDVSVITVNVDDDKGRIVPTSDNLVSFSVQGPIRIIGVGNGDPGSHEADHPVDRYRYISLSHWRSLAVDSVAGRSEMAQTVDTASWRDPFVWLPPEQQPPATKALVVRGEFAMPDMRDSETAQLSVATLGANQSVYVNGQLAKLRSQDGGSIIDLNRSDLNAMNSLTYIFEMPDGGVPKLADASQNGVNWASLRITTPAQAWQRRVFNGSAQVLVQSTGDSGTGIVTATSEGLKSGHVSLVVAM
jgi:beta-galactosidase